MKKRFLLLAVAIAFNACQRGPTPADAEAERRRAAELQAIDDKLAELKDLERQASERKLAETEQRARESEGRATASERERERLETERKALIKDRERLAREQAAAEERARAAEDEADAAARNVEEQTVDFFYTALEPYGEWLEVERYGYVWQPRAASDVRWRPYTDGRWVYTDYGWFWKSNEPFGWAAYHYGRWARIRRIGWVWVPGTEWGPAWVSWRRGDRYAGWAPLPPEAWSKNGFTAAVDSYYDIGPGSYNFVAIDELAQPTYLGRVIEPARNVTLVNQTVNVTNVTYKTVQKNVVVYSAGPDLSALAPKTAQSIPRLKVERITRGKGDRESGRSEQRGERLLVEAPRIRDSRENGKDAKPARIKERVKSPEVERGWEAGNRQEAEQARAKVKREAAQAEEQQRKPAIPKPSAATPSSKPAVQTTPELKPAKPEPKPIPTTPASSPAATPIPAPGAPGRDREGKNGRPHGKDQKPAPPATPTTSKPAPAEPGNGLPAPTAPMPAPSAPGRGRDKEEKKGRPQGNDRKPMSPEAPLATPNPAPSEPAAEVPALKSAIPTPEPQSGRKPEDNARPRRNLDNGFGRDQRRRDPGSEVKPGRTPLTPPEPETQQDVKKAIQPPASVPAVPEKPKSAVDEPKSPSASEPSRRLPKMERQRPDRPSADALSSSAGKPQEPRRPDGRKRQEGDKPGEM